MLLRVAAVHVTPTRSALDMSASERKPRRSRPDGGQVFRRTPGFQMGDLAVSKLTSKYQTTVPSSIRETLGLSKGDSIVFETAADGAVTVRKALPLDLELARALEPLLSEWSSDKDAEAYRGL
jgi:antitoxin PrlF